MQDSNFLQSTKACLHMAATSYARAVRLGNQQRQEKILNRIESLVAGFNEKQTKQLDCFLNETFKQLGL